jgi:hypothetical protein
MDLNKEWSKLLIGIFQTLIGVQMLQVENIREKGWASNEA